MKKTKSKTRGKVSLANKLFGSRRSQIITMLVSFAVIGAAYTLYVSAQTPRYFNPTTPISRQAMAAFLYRSAGSPAVNNSNCGPGKQGPFNDVSATSQFCKEIEWMKNNNIAGSPTFRPAASVTHEVAAAFLYRLDGSPAFSRSINQQCSSGQGQPNNPPYSDVNSGNRFCKEIAYIKSKGYTSEVISPTSFEPKKTATRQAIAVMLHNRAGKPKPTNPNAAFTDVSKNHRFYDAIQWVGERKISDGHNKTIAPIRPSNEGANRPTPTPTPSTPAPSNPLYAAITRDPLYDKNLCKGMGGALVRNLQSRLSKMGLGVTENGFYGETTAKAVSTWRIAHGRPAGNPGCFYSKTMLSKFRASEKAKWKYSPITGQHMCPGASGAGVRELQERLRKLGFNRISPNGSYGQTTAEAVNYFHALRTPSASRGGKGCFNANSMLSALTTAERQKWNATAAVNSLNAFFHAISRPVAAAPSPAAVISVQRPPAPTPPPLDPAVVAFLNCLDGSCGGGGGGGGGGGPAAAPSGDPAGPPSPVGRCNVRKVNEGRVTTMRSYMDFSTCERVFATGNNVLYSSWRQVSLDRSYEIKDHRQRPKTCVVTHNNGQRTTDNNRTHSGCLHLTQQVFRTNHRSATWGGASIVPYKN